HDAAYGRVDHEPRVVGDRVRHLEEVDGEVLADLHAVVGGDLPEVDVGLLDAELVELPAQEAQGELRPVHGHLRQQPEHVGDAADVVLVPVGKDPALDLVRILDDPVDLGDEDVHAEHVGVGEGQPAVDEEDLVLVLEGEHVLPDLAHAPEGDHAQLAFVACHTTPLPALCGRGRGRLTPCHAGPRGPPRPLCGSRVSWLCTPNRR